MLRSRAPVWPARLLVLATIVAMAGCREPAPSPNVVLLVLDTLRADRLGAYGNERGLTPFMDRLAAEGTVFENAYAPSSWTCPSVASLLTSRFPSQHHVATFDSKLSDSESTLAEHLAEHGYATAGFSANFRLTHNLGYAQGFGTWKVFFKPKVPKVRGQALRREASQWLDSLEGGKPWFLYLQYMEPHSPYVPPEPFRARFVPPTPGVDATTANEKLVRLRLKELSVPEVELLRHLYDAEVASLDEELRLLFEELHQRGVLANTVIIVTADHGEEFGEHGDYLHGRTLFEPAIRIPLILHGAGIPEGHRIKDPVSLVDVAPTILELAGAAPFQQQEGRSLAGALERSWLSWVLRDREPRPSDLLVQLPRSGSSFDLRRHSEGILRLPAKLLVMPSGEVVTYDLTSDPGETRPNPPRLATAGAELLAALHAHQTALKLRANPTGEKAVVDEATREKLRTLGYSF